ncbi:phosphoribosylaminoimidazolesuccinocarboxamide synthase [Microbacterium gorillae]|uniref:phosphoribosylaminoimidazolesuccinocarboxamide synthase n=1 Tax=Microbacterium gorillae TaxID=1231063 RepID=UPI00058C3FDD|nr:phosphoribosylaminoimidazolesuccinocarboxamide synthase [Microbacterium gorillae]
MGGVSNPAEVPGWNHVYSGKVRDLYEPADGPADRMLVVASDRVSAFDVVLSPGIPEKGALLTALSDWWFDQLSGADGGEPVANHLTGATVPDVVAGRATIARKLTMIPIECVVRGYLTGSGWKEYRATGAVCGVELPDGLHDGDRLPEPIFTPAYKAPMGEHDENITFERATELVGEELASDLRDISLAIYRRAAATAEAHGLILADTKFEFGRDEDGVLTLGDEVLTSDSSRYWDKVAWESETDPADRMASFDKQIVRNWLAANWDQTGTPPELPAEIVTRTADRYRELLTRLRG